VSARWSGLCWRTRHGATACCSGRWSPRVFTICLVGVALKLLII
jgi:hypothetical protein